MKKRCFVPVFVVGKTHTSNIIGKILNFNVLVHCINVNWATTVLFYNINFYHYVFIDKA